VDDFDDNINFYVLYLLLGGSAVNKIRFIDNIFYSPTRESSFPILYFVGLTNFLLMSNAYCD